MKYIGIKNNLQFPQIELPKCLSSRINICTNVDLKLDEIEAFSESLTLLQKQLEFENILAKDIRFINIIFTDNFEYTFVNTIPRTFGLLQNIIVYAVGNLRIENSSRVNYMGVFLEELCHHIWDIENEIIVKQKVMQILSLGNISVTWNYTTGYQICDKK